MLEPGTNNGELAPMRAEVLAEQKELLEALVLGKDVPAGFASRRIEEAAQALVRKRKRSILRACPQLLLLTATSAEMFLAMDHYFAVRPGCPAAGPYRDAMEFIVFLAASPELGIVVPGELHGQARRFTGNGNRWFGLAWFGLAQDGRLKERLEELMQKLKL
jgi:hypothetical protein